MHFKTRLDSQHVTVHIDAKDIYLPFSMLYPTIRNVLLMRHIFISVLNLWIQRRIILMQFTLSHKFCIPREYCSHKEMPGLLTGFHTSCRIKIYSGQSEKIIHSPTCILWDVAHKSWHIILNSCHLPVSSSIWKCVVNEQVTNSLISAIK